MPVKKRDRFTVEVSGRIENCGSYEMAMTRFNDLTKLKPCSLHVIFRVNGVIIAEHIPLIINGVAVDL